MRLTHVWDFRAFLPGFPFSSIVKSRFVYLPCTECIKEEEEEEEEEEKKKTGHVFPLNCIFYLLHHSP